VIAAAAESTAAAALLTASAADVLCSKQLLNCDAADSCLMYY
jgi:hypothetical protein